MTSLPVYPQPAWPNSDFSPDRVPRSGYREGWLGVALRCAYWALLSGSSMWDFRIIP